MAAAGAQLDVDQHDWIIPEDEDDCTAPEPPGHIMAQQQEMFWQGENMSRVRNGAMTPYERHLLQNLAEQANTPPRVQQDIKKLISNFAKPQGAGAAARRLLKYLVDEYPIPIGQKVPINSLGFTVAKHLLIADRGTYVDLNEGRYTIGCSCLAATYLMPEGCRHKKLKLYKEQFLPHTLCKDCSYCIRCHKFLGLCLDNQSRFTCDKLYPFPLI